MEDILSPRGSAPATEKISIVHGPIIVGAGPSGLAVAASLRLSSVPFVILERSDGIADLWRHHTYNRLCLHLPRSFCQLPHLPFPAHFPTYPTKDQFLTYLHSYADHFSLRPIFNCTVVAARFDSVASLWRVTAVNRRHFYEADTISPSESSDSLSTRSLSSDLSETPTECTEEVVEYVSPWLVVATGENAEPVVPEVKGIESFNGSMLHSSEYKTGLKYSGEKVLVVGCGNSGMEACVDLCEHGAVPSMSVRSVVHVLPRDIFGTSTFGVAMKMLKWLPLKLVDRFLLIMAKIILGNTEKYGLKRPKVGPFEYKYITGRTPVLDNGAFSLIKAGKIKIVPEVESLTRDGAKFVDRKEMGFDSVIFATGYRSNVPFWLKGSSHSSSPSSSCVEGEKCLHLVGFTGKGLLGASEDALKTASLISERWRELTNKKRILFFEPSRII